MPASNLNVYNMQDARNNFGAVRPVPICADANEYIGQCRNRIHVSTNIYYGYHAPKAPEVETDQVNTDFEMETCSDVEISVAKNARKRNADDFQHLQNKRLKEDDCSMWSLVGTRSSPSHSASAFNVKNIKPFYSIHFSWKCIFSYFLN